MRYNYKYGDGSVVDETSANFKKMGEDRKAKKKESIGKFVVCLFGLMFQCWGEGLCLPPLHFH